MPDVAAKPVPMRPGAIPRATYRLQFQRGFTLRDALGLVPYLADLGVSHLYASPLLKACPGSAHGYDVCDPSQLNPEIGGDADLGALVEALFERGMGLVLDLVPNHMGIQCPENRWWWDVLRHGRASRYAGHFDIDWESSDPGLRGRVLVPVLGDAYPRVLERGELKLEQRQGAFSLRYYEHAFPLSPESESALLRRAGPGEALVELNASPAALGELIELQHYRLAWWRLGDERLNYRRFFNVLHLAGLRIEREPVFHDVHQLALEWSRRGWVQGLRIDHPDGLRDPRGYVERLRRAAPDAWIVLEKILVPGEELPEDWPVEGTTGYDFLNQAGGLFVDPANEQALTGFYREFTGEPEDYESVLREKKRQACGKLFGAELNRLLDLLDAAMEGAEAPAGFERAQAREALIEIVACFPVYRTYIQAEGGGVGATDLERIGQAAARAGRSRPDLAQAIGFLGGVLTMRTPADRAAEFVMRFQQLTGPAMAKGGEDTAYYCYNRFVALNEVGGDPGTFGLRLEEFHRCCQRRGARWPNAMLASSTHDTKRSEDVRARLALLSEIPAEWIAAVRRWSARLEARRRGGRPDRNMEYHVYQTLVGAWPLTFERAWAYLLKAAREAKAHTSWADPNRPYEEALEGFIAGALGDREFVSDLERFLEPLVQPGRVNSLSQTLLKLTAPGVPDLYQGTELWDLSLVDPDNRRPVDFGRRRAMLDELGGLSGEEAWRRSESGLPKLWLIQKTLALRRRHPGHFDRDASYRPMIAAGSKAARVVAFGRGENVVVVVPRLLLGLGGDWSDTELMLAPGEWRNGFGGETVPGGPCPVGRLLNQFPVALLWREAAPGRQIAAADSVEAAACE